MDTIYEFMVVPFVEIEIRLGTIGKTFDSSIDKKYFEKIRDHLETGDWVSICNKNTIEYCKKETNLKLINVDKLNYLMVKENLHKEDFQMKSCPFDIRYSINQEFKFKNTESFDKDDCLIRNKCRKTFMSEHFRYDLTIVNEINNNINKTKYEIEIEIIINKENITWTKIYINDFLECKIYDLVNIVEPIERDKFKINLIKC